MKPLLLSLLICCSQLLFAQVNDSAAARQDTIAKALATVVVRGGKKPIDIQADKVVLNLDAQPSAVGEHLLDVLRRSPGVMVDAADNINLNGKGNVTVLIDGKNTQLSPQDLAQLLKSMQATTVSQIELISNPSAKYDAAGAGGIINIKMKKSPNNGFNGNISGSYVQSTHARQNGSANLNWRKNKTALFFNGSADGGSQDVIANNDRRSGNTSFTQRSLEKNRFHGYSIRAGIDHNLNEKSTLGFLWMRNNKYSGMENRSTTLMQGPPAIDTVFKTISIAPFYNNRNAFNLNYNYSGSSLTYSIDADLTRFRSSVYNTVSNDIYDGSNTVPGSTATINDQQVEIDLYSLKADLVKTLSKAMKLEAGFKLAATRTNNTLDVSNKQVQQWISDTGKTNTFNYREDIHAAYAILKEDREKISWQLGLRTEFTRVEGRSAGLQNIVLKQPSSAYVNLFPSVFLQYRLSQEHQLGLTANRRIDRPNYQDQNPFIYFLDALNTEQGNAFLSPQFTNNIELSYTYKYATSIRLSYAHTSGHIEWLTYQSDKYTVQKPENAGSRQMLAISISSPVKFTKAWSAYISMTPYYHFYRTTLNSYGLRELQRGGSWAFNGYLGNNFELGKGWKANLGGWFNFQNRATIYVSKPIGSLDFGIQKNIWEGRATLKLALVDLFNTQRWEQRGSTGQLEMKTYRKWESRNITIGFSCRFGNSKLQKARDREAGNEEGKRIK